MYPQPLTGAEAKQLQDAAFTGVDSFLCGFDTVVKCLSCNRYLRWLSLIINQSATAAVNTDALRKLIHTIQNRNKGVHDCASYPADFDKLTLALSLLDLLANVAEARSYDKHMRVPGLESCRGSCGSLCCGSASVDEGQSLLAASHNIQQAAAPSAVAVYGLGAMSAVGAVMRGAAGTAALAKAVGDIISAVKFEPCDLSNVVLGGAIGAGAFASIWKMLTVWLDTYHPGDSKPPWVERLLAMLNHPFSKKILMLILNYLYSLIRYLPLFAGEIAALYVAIQQRKTNDEDWSGLVVKFIFTALWALVSIGVISRAKLQILQSNLEQLSSQSQDAATAQSRPNTPKVLAITAASWAAQGLAVGAADIVAKAALSQESEHFNALYTLLCILIGIPAFIVMYMQMR